MANNGVEVRRLNWSIGLDRILDHSIGSETGTAGETRRVHFMHH